MKKKKMNDKGFSLVELIIVIAIMAILIAVLAPQYLKFVERSRKSADRDTVDQLVRAVQIDYADPETTNNPAGTITVTNKSTAVTVSNATGDLYKILTAAGINNIVLKSHEWEGAATVSDGDAIYIHLKLNDNGNIDYCVDANATAPSSFSTTIKDGTGADAKLITE